MCYDMTSCDNKCRVSCSVVQSHLCDGLVVLPVSEVALEPYRSGAQRAYVDGLLQVSDEVDTQAVPDGPQ